MKTVAYRHPVQLFILEQLRVASAGLRYTDMRPPDTENDLYNYHLRHLVNNGLVEKHASAYSLTPDGMKYVIELNPVTELGESHRFKLASMCLVVRGYADQTEVLYQRRSRQPHLGESGFIGGGIKRGEPATDTARRRIREEAGLTASFSLLGMIRKRRFDPAGDIFSDILFHACVSTDAHGQLIAQNEYGQQQWVALDTAIGIETHGIVGSPELAVVLAQLRNTPPGRIPLFYFDEVYHNEIF